MPLLEIKDFNALVDSKQFFDQPTKNKQEKYEKPVEILRKNDFKTRNVLDYLHHQNYYKDQFIKTKKNTSIPEHISFKEKLEDDNGAPMFFLSLKSMRKAL